MCVLEIQNGSVIREKLLRQDCKDRLGIDQVGLCMPQ